MVRQKRPTAHVLLHHVFITAASTFGLDDRPHALEAVSQRRRTEKVHASIVHPIQNGIRSIQSRNGL